MKDWRLFFGDSSWAYSSVPYKKYIIYIMMWLQTGMIYIEVTESQALWILTVLVLPEDAPGWNLIDAVVKRSPKKNPPAIKHSWLEMPFFAERNMGVSENRGTPKSSILIGFSIINHPFLGTSIFGNTHMKLHPRHAMSFSNWIPKTQWFAGNCYRTAFGAGFFRGW